MRARDSFSSRVASCRSVTSRTIATTSSSEAGAIRTSKSRSSPRCVRSRYSTVREPAGLERRTDARHQLLGDFGWKQIADPRPDNDIRRIREARDVTGDLEVGAVGPQPQQQVGKSVEQRPEARLDRRGDPTHAFIVVGVRRSERYVEAMAQPKKKSLQDVLRERRAAAPLLSARELREREAARRREEVEREAARLVARWRAERTAVDAEGSSALRSTRRSSRRAGPRTWRASTGRAARRRSARRRRPARSPGVGRPMGCAPTTSATKRSARNAPSIWSRSASAAPRRAVKLERELGRPGTRAELQALDPEQPLYDPSTIAALRAKHSRPLGP